MKQFDKLVLKIEKLLGENANIVVAISGFGGSGKSHLADKLRGYFKIDEKQTIRIDNLYGPNPDGPDIFDQTDWVLIERILRDVQAGQNLKYQGKSFKGDVLIFDEQLPKVLIVEGIRLLQPKLMPLFNISVWINCPQELAVQRAKSRDLKQGEDIETIKRWDTDWGPKDKEYFNKYRPDKLADFLYDTF